MGMMPSGGVTSADLQNEASLRQQGDAQVLAQAEQYTDNAIASANLQHGCAERGAGGEHSRPAAGRPRSRTQLPRRRSRAQTAEGALAASIPAAAAPKLLFSGSPVPPDGYLFSGLSIQSTGSPTPEALSALGLPNIPGQSSFTLYLHIKN